MGKVFTAISKGEYVGKLKVTKYKSHNKMNEPNILKWERIKYMVVVRLQNVWINIEEDIRGVNAESGFTIDSSLW